LSTDIDAPVATDLRSDGPRVQALSDWLVQQGLRGTTLDDLLAGFCEGLRTLGIPLWRGQIGMRTLHPSFEALTYRWLREEGVQRAEIAYEESTSPEWQRSPFHHMLETDNFALRRRLAGPDARVDFPLLEEFREQGATDYVARMMPFGDSGTLEGRTGVLTSWTTDRPEGFADEEIATLDRLQPRFALTIKTILAEEITRNVADTYIGPEAGRRILSGEIRRGSVQVIHAVIFFADLRGFTALTDRVPRDELVPMLDDYLECMARPIVDHGGQVLKFLGDGLLATFDLSGKAGDSICRDTLDAALQALCRTDELNAARAAAGKPTMAIDVALHLGDVLYGNVGAMDRLDFTVIGPAVNEASRIENLCDTVGRRLLVSSTFAEAATQCTGRLLSVGKHQLRGLDREQELFTLDAPETLS
jgi:adenylate cyclase